MPGTHCTILAPIFNLRQFCGNRRQMPEIGGKYLSCEWQLCSVCYHQRLCLLQIWPISRCYASKLKLINISFALIQVLGLPAPLAQNQLSKRTCFRRVVPVIEGNHCLLNHAGAVSSAHRFSNRTCPKETVLGSVYWWSENHYNRFLTREREPL